MFSNSNNIDDVNRLGVDQLKILVRILNVLHSDPGAIDYSVKAARTFF